jgi:protein-ribulosamine 3-kinase
LVADALGQALGHEVGPIELRSVGGGCINEAATATVRGVTYFVKWNDRPLAGQFAAEAAGLRALRESGSPLVVPEVVTLCDEGPGRSFLVLEHLAPGQRQSGFDEALGHGLAELHRTRSAQGFGFPIDGYCGATPQPNGWQDTWTAFYAERRIGHQLALAMARGGLRQDALRNGARLCDRFEELLGDPEPPALIHGDLWSGNLHVASDGRPALIDPAAYFGHREAELGMMVLFGGFSQRVFDAYDEAYPLQPGWRERQDLYSLYHVLNHFNLFGGGYGQQAAQIIARYA